MMKSRMLRREGIGLVIPIISLSPSASHNKKGVGTIVDITSPEALDCL